MAFSFSFDSGALVQWSLIFHSADQTDHNQPEEDTGHHHQLATPTVLVVIPTPDFTMPYNVIMLTSTLIALAYGITFNLMFRRFYLVDQESKGSPLKRGVRFIASLLPGLLSRIRQKLRPHAHAE